MTYTRSDIIPQMTNVTGSWITYTYSPKNSATRLAQIVADDEDHDFTEEEHKEFQQMIDKYNVKYNNKLVKVLR